MTVDLTEMKELFIRYGSPVTDVELNNRFSDWINKQYKEPISILQPYSMQGELLSVKYVEKPSIVLRQFWGSTGWLEHRYRFLSHQEDLISFDSMSDCTWYSMDQLSDCIEEQERDCTAV